MIQLKDVFSPFLLLDKKSKILGQDPQLLQSSIAPLLLAKLGRFTLAEVIARSVCKKSFCLDRFFLPFSKIEFTSRKMSGLSEASGRQNPLF